jgi:phage N-6-adenine-methyltransferase
MGLINESWYTSNADNWGTPQKLFDELNTEFGFTLDACADEVNFKVSNYYTKEQDSLKQDWEGIVWCNPPYSRALKLWMAKVVEAWETGATVVCLVPARTDTGWWHDYAMKATEIRFLRGRLRFDRPGMKLDNAPFPSAVLVFKPKSKEDD